MENILSFLGNILQIIPDNKKCAIAVTALIPCVIFIIKIREKIYNFLRVVILYRIKLTADRSKEKWEENDKKNVFDRFCFALTHNSKEDLCINPEKIYINDDIFNGVIKLDNDEPLEKKPFLWSKYKKLQLLFSVFPCAENDKRLCSFKGNANFMEKSLLFKAKNKISVTVEVNKKILR